MVKSVKKVRSYRKDKEVKKKKKVQLTKKWKKLFPLWLKANGILKLDFITLEWAFWIEKGGVLVIIIIAYLCSISLLILPSPHWGRDLMDKSEVIEQNVLFPKELKNSSKCFFGSVEITKVL